MTINHDLVMTDTPLQPFHIDIGVSCTVGKVLTWAY